MATIDQSFSPKQPAGERSPSQAGCAFLGYLELEQLADKIIEMMKNELSIENEREGRMP